MVLVKVMVAGFVVKLFPPNIKEMVGDAAGVTVTEQVSVKLL